MTVATKSTELCSASEINAKLPMAIPTASLTEAMVKLATIEIAATRDLMVVTESFMGRGLAAHLATSKPIGFAIANQSQAILRIVMNQDSWLQVGRSAGNAAQYFTGAACFPRGSVFWC